MSDPLDALTVTDLELFSVPPRWLFLRVETEGGLVGWGEPVVEGRARTVRAAVEELAEGLVGRSAARIEDCWQTFYRGGFYRGGPVLMSAIAGIDQALWDLKGKALGVPVYDLLGGPVKDRQKVYGWIGGDRPQDVAEAAAERVEAGYRAVKMNATAEMEWIESAAPIDEAAGRLEAVREAVGPEVGVAVDFHGRVHKGMVRRLASALETYRPLFLEEPVLPENNEILPELRALTSAPIATGERMYSRWDFKSLFETGGADVVQPDLSHAGGISEVKRIAGMAEAHDVALAPHCPLGPIAFAAALQVDFTCVNAFIQETSLGIHYNEGADLLDYLTDPSVFAFSDGYVERPSGPGLGIEIDEETVRRRSGTTEDWHNPIWRSPDGTILEW